MYIYISAYFKSYSGLFQTGQDPGPWLAVKKPGSEPDWKFVGQIRASYSQKVEGAIKES